jgi:hypothetical protein
MNDRQRYLRLFDLPETATAGDVKQAYRRLVHDWHPDRIVGDEGLRRQAEERFKELNLAYHALVKMISPARIDPEGGASGSDSKRHAFIWTLLDKDIWTTDADQEVLFPLLNEVTSQHGFVGAAWNTFEGAWQASWEQHQGRDGTRELVIALEKLAERTKVRFSLGFKHKIDSLKVGFVDGLDMPKILGQALQAETMTAEQRQALKQEYFRNIQLHESTWTERKRASCRRRQEGEGEVLAIDGLSRNQALNLIYQAFHRCGARTIRWNTHHQIVYGTTGWSVRSCGQRLEAHLRGDRRSFEIGITSQPLDYSGLPKPELRDLGRGREEINRVLTDIQAQFPANT